MTQQPKMLLDPVSDALHLNHWSIRPENAFANWIKHYIYSRDIHQQPLGRW
jgi:hypothetical protein